MTEHVQAPDGTRITAVVLVATGAQYRKPDIEGLGRLGFPIGIVAEDGSVVVDDHLRTSVPHVQRLIHHLEDALSELEKAFT